MQMLSSRSAAALILTATVVIAGCGGGGDGGTPPSTTAIAKTPANSGDAQSATVGLPLANPIQVVVTEGGSPSAGTTITWSTAAGGSLTPGSGPTGADGVAGSGWTLGTTSGAQTASATLAGATGSPVTFTATALADAATTVIKTGGDGQTGEIGSQLALPVQARVTDQHGNGVLGVAVGWSATGGTPSSLSVPSNASGLSSVNVTVDGPAGPIVITATAGTLTGSPLTFTATATTAPTTAAVSVSNNSFNPPAITVAAGTTVVWTWSSGATGHNVAPAGTVPTRSGGLVNAPATYQFRFNTPGTYQYYCEAHGSPGFGMAGTVTVQ